MSDEPETEETFEADNDPLSLSDKGERKTVAEERDDASGTRDVYEADNDPLSLSDKGERTEVVVYMNIQKTTFKFDAGHFAKTMTLAAMGCHFRKLTGNYCR